MLLSVNIKINKVIYLLKIISFSTYFHIKYLLTPIRKTFLGNKKRVIKRQRFRLKINLYKKG